MNNPNKHPFSHLGPSPYKFLSSETTEDRTRINAGRAQAGELCTTNMCGGTCEHCGTEIWTVYRFQAGNGRIFKVGSSCVLKGFDADPALNRSPEFLAFKAARAKMAKSARKNREARKLAEGRAWLALDRTKMHLAALPHPSPYRATMGDTALDWAAWALANMGNTGLLKMFKRAREMLAD